MNRILRMICVLLVLALPACAVAGDDQTLYKELAAPSGDPIPYAVHLPDGFDPESTYPVLLGPGDAVEGSEAGFYWKTDAHRIQCRGRKVPRSLLERQQRRHFRTDHRPRRALSQHHRNGR